MSNKFPMYRNGTREEVTSGDLTDRIAKVISDIYSVRYGCKVTFKFGGGDGDGNQISASNAEAN